jgi:hypothetical protein
MRTIPSGKPPKPANHHWWPRSLSKQWAGSDGGVSQLSWDGSEVRSNPSNFGAIRNAHHLTRGNDSPWNATFEPVFDKADNTFPSLTEWLLRLNAKRAGRDTFDDRFEAKPLSQERRLELAECLASLIVRSPRSRNNIKITIESYLAVDRTSGYSVDKTLIAANMHSSQGVVSKTISGGGKFVVLISDRDELICGDGFLHNFPIGTDRSISPRCIIPILPSVAILYARPISYRPQPELITMLLRPNEVRFLNDIVQVYSCKRLFFRSQRPKLISKFTKCEHMELAYHSHPWLDQLIEAAGRFLPRSKGSAGQ